MHIRPVPRCLLLVAALALRVAAPVAAQQLPPALPADVATIDGIVHAYYDVINGPAGQPRQWRRDSTLYMPTAMFVEMSIKDGAPHATVQSPEEFRRMVNADFVKNGFYETELGKRVERFGNVAQVRSLYETRRTEKGPLLGRGINYIHLYWDGTRWWIAGAVWDNERKDNPLPKGWIGTNEKAP